MHSSSFRQQRSFASTALVISTDKIRTGCAVDEGKKQVSQAFPEFFNFGKFSVRFLIATQFFHAVFWFLEMQIVKRF